MFLVPDFKGFDFFPHGTHLDFMRWKGICLALSIVAMLASLGLFLTKGLNYGVDFKGGSLIEVQAKSGTADLSTVRQKLGALGLGDVQVQSFGAPSDVLIRVEEQPGGDKAQQDALAKVVAALGDGFTQRRVEVVGPAVSSELRTTGIIAVLASIVAIILYVWFRFEWQFAAGTIIALTHDVLVTVGLFSLFSLEFDLSIVAALLTILGYSVNDTVVIFDRIRERFRSMRKAAPAEVIDRAINETLGRTIIVAGCALSSVLFLAVLGGETLRGFGVALAIGIVIGTYSSIYVAGTIALDLGASQRDFMPPEKRGEVDALP